MILGCANTEIPDTVKKIGPYSFARIWKENVVIPNSVVEIGEFSFENSFLSGELVIPGSVKSIGKGAFFGCPGLERVILESGVERIEDKCFYYSMDNLETLVIPDSVNYIGDILDYGTKQLLEYKLLTVYCSKGSYAEQWCIENEKNYNMTHNTTDNWKDVSIETTESTETSATEATTTQVSTTTQVQTQGTTQKQITTQEKVTPNAIPKAQKISIAKMKSFKAKKLKKKKQVFSLKASANGKLTYKVVKGKSKYITINKKGVVTLKKGCKKGIYKIKITAAKTTGYKKTTKVVVIKVS